ncbi:MAG: hypothetical protein RPR98_05500 [Bermanella sp.]|jgi:hypothetical protein
MSAQLKSQTSQDLHYWMLWIAPNALQTQLIKKRPLSDRQRVLMLHPKDLQQLSRALEVAIVSDLYQIITLPRALLSSDQQHKLATLAVRHHTVLSWLGSPPRLNSARQLTLI